VDYDAFVVDTYYVKTQELKEKYLAAAGAKQQWDFKVSTNNLLITLNAIALFLLGLSVTISGSITRGIFSRMGMVIAVGVSAWGALNFFAPVKDLRDFPGAIEAYAQASGYSYRGEYTDAVTKYDEALLLAPDYARAYRGRGDAYYYLDDYKAAITDLEKARQYGDQTFGTGGNLGWYYYLDSRFADAIQLDREIVAEYPGELWIRFNLAVTLLADGQVLEALDEYERGMVIAEQWVADAQSSGNPVPVTLWWSLRVAPLDLDGLIKIIDTGEGFPVFSSLKSTAEARTEAEKMIYKLRTLENGLELTGKPPQETTTAVVSPFEFGEKVYDENDAFLRYDKSTVWDYGTKRVYLLFDYTGFKTGQETMYKVYLNGDELRMWRYAEPWPLGEAGSAEKLFRYFDSDDFIFSKGDYVVELYIDNILVQRGTFSVVDASG
jgi:tetratricopeptide (TPR) repeat protein